MKRDEISVKTTKREEILPVTDRVGDVIESSNVEEGLLHLWVPHTTATITVNEADPELLKDILEYFKKIAPEGRGYRHDAKYEGAAGEQNTHAHLISSTLKNDVTIPVSRGRISLGTWQSVLFVERDGPRNRRIVCTIL